MLRSILPSGVDLSKVDTDGNSPLHLAVRAAIGEAEDEEPFIEVDGEASDASSLAAALERFPASAVSAALQLHNRKDGRTPLHLAAAGGSSSVCEVLLQAGAAVDSYTLRRASLPQIRCGYWVVRGSAGQVQPLNKAADQTALHLAVECLVEEQSEDTALVRLLIEHGADVGALDSRRRTPLERAISGGLHAVVELLAEAVWRRAHVGRGRLGHVHDIPRHVP